VWPIFFGVKDNSSGDIGFSEPRVTALTADPKLLDAKSIKVFNLFVF